MLATVVSKRLLQNDKTETFYESYTSKAFLLVLGNVMILHCDRLKGLHDPFIFILFFLLQRKRDHKYPDTKHISCVTLRPGPMGCFMNHTLLSSLIQEQVVA